MKLTYRFDLFDPLMGELPERYVFMFIDVVLRARVMLQGRTTEEIKQGAFVINKIARDPAYVDPLWKSLKEPPIKTMLLGKEEEILPSYNDVEALYQNIGNISLVDFPILPNVQWHEVFAILALSYVEMVFYELHSQEAWPPDHWLPRITDAQIDIHAQEYLGLAKQAITFADVLINQTATVRKLASEQTSQAARKRHQSGSGPLKAAVLDIYQEKYTARSNRDAAHRIFEDLTLQGRLAYDGHTTKVNFDNSPALQTDDPEHRFEIWIGRANKSGT